MHNYAEIFFTSNVHHTVQHFDIVSAKFRKKKTLQYFLRAFLHGNEAI